MAETTEKQTAPAAAAKTAEKPADKTPAAAAVDPVPDGHRRVMWVYCAGDTDRNGTVEDIPAGEAAALVEGNRVKYVDDETPLGPSNRPTHPERRAGGRAAADTGK